MADGSRGNDALRLRAILGAVAGGLLAAFVSIPLFWDSVTNIPTMIFVVVGALVGAGVAAITAPRASKDGQ